MKCLWSQNNDVSVKHCLFEKHKDGGDNLPYKHEELSLLPRSHLLKDCVYMVVCTCDPSAESAGIGRASSTWQVPASGLPRPCLKNLRGRVPKE